VSVIVPVRNGARTLGALLHSLKAQTLAADRFEVIVVDNDSTDATAEVAVRAGVELVTEPIANRSRARNRGAAAARSRRYAFIDADCVADAGWLATLLECAHSAALVAGEVTLRVGERPNAIERFERMWRFGQREWVEEQGWAATANLLVDAEAFHAVGGFDASYRHIGEDADFCLRARAAGYGLGYCAEARVAHEGERELRPFLRRLFLHGYSANQVHYRLGVGARAWRDPLPALAGRRALRRLCPGEPPRDSRERRRMARLAQLGYGARVAGSVWSELTRAR